MTILSRYLLKESLVPAGMGLLFLLFILIANRFLKLFPILVEARIPVGELFVTLLFLIPSFLVFVLPPALFLGWVVGLSRLGSDGELVGAMGLGLSFFRFLRVPFFISLLGGLLCLILSQWGYAQGRAEFSYRVKDLVRRYTLNALTPGTLIELPRQSFVAMGQRRGSESSVVYFGSRELGVIAGYLSPSEGVTSALTLAPGFLYTESATAPVLAAFERGRVEVELPLEEQPSALEDTLLYLFQHRDDPQNAYTFYRYLSFAFSFLYAPFAAYLIASRRLRSGRGNALLRTVVALLLFYTLLNLGQRLFQKQLFPPFLAAFLPHLLLLPAGVLLYAKLTRPGQP